MALEVNFELAASPVPHILQRSFFAARKHPLAIYRYRIVLTCLCGTALALPEGRLSMSAVYARHETPAAGLV